MAEKNKVGRPKREFCLTDDQLEGVLDLYSNGASDIEVVCYIREQLGVFSRHLFYTWLEENEKFSDTILAGRDLAQRWWERQGRTNLENTKFNDRLWFINVRNRFEGYQDKVESKNTHEVTSTVINLGSGQSPENE